MICVREPLFWVRLACSTNWRKVRLYVYEGQVLSNTWNTPALDNSIFYDEIILSIQMLKHLKKQYSLVVAVLALILSQLSS